MMHSKEFLAKMGTVQKREVRTTLRTLKKLLDDQVPVEQAIRKTLDLRIARIDGKEPSGRQFK